MLSIVSHGLSSGGLAWNHGQLYGRWEVRARTQQATGYGDVLILWPDAEDFPVGGEIDFMEIPKAARNDYNFNLHYGQQVFRTDDRSQIPPRSMHLAMQQDIGPYGDNWIPARNATTPPEVKFQMDWVRIYPA